MQSDVMEESTYRVTLCKRNIFDSRDSLECENHRSLNLMRMRRWRRKDRGAGRTYHEGFLPISSRAIFQIRDINLH